MATLMITLGDFLIGKLCPAKEKNEKSEEDPLLEESNQNDLTKDELRKEVSGK